LPLDAKDGITLELDDGYHGSMSEQLRTSCVCGWEAVGAEDEVVEKTLDHGLRVHNMAGTRDEVLARAERLSDPAPEPQLDVVDVPERHMFEARLDGRPVGFTQYNVRDGAIILLHTEIDPDQEGKGIGSRLARAVLANAQARGLEIVVRCPFIAAYVRRHRSDYPDIDLDRPTPRAASAG
jgi:predicted GNAT family acetyltransferase